MILKNIIVNEVILGKYFKDFIIKQSIKVCNACVTNATEYQDYSIT